MCTVVILRGVHPHYPVLVAANRDELYARATRDPEVLAEEPRAVGGVDVARGGTWFGATASGFLAGITNQRSWGLRDPELASRGKVVLDALRRGTREGVRALLASLSPADYNGFNLLFGDAERLDVAYARRSEPAIRIEPVPRGVHVLPNDELDSPEFAKVARAGSLAAETVGDEPWDDLRRVLADHEQPALEAVVEPPPESPLTRDLVRELDAVCVHTPHYGTRSATILALEPGRTARYLYAPGKPCETGFRDLTGMLRG